MLYLLIQAGAPAGVTLDLPWLIAGVSTIIGSLAATVGVVYRGQIAALKATNDLLQAEGKRKDELINELIVQLGRTTDVQERTVGVVERARR